MTTPVGLAIVGAGRMGITHVEALRDEPSVRVNAIVDPSEAARANALRAAPGAAGCAGLDDALAGGGIEAVLIAAPSPLHLALVEACAARGLPILCEKPCGTTAAEARSADRHGASGDAASATDALIALEAAERLQPGVTAATPVSPST